MCSLGTTIDMIIYVLLCLFHSKQFIYFACLYLLQFNLFIQWGLFDKQFGRSDAEEPDPEGRVPLWEKASVKEMKDKFSAVGFGPRQVIRLKNPITNDAYFDQIYIV